MTTPLTVADIVADPSLDTSVLSGSGGLDRTVLWAHSCEMADPARWLAPHELLMTIGLCLPAGSDAQRDFVARLDDAGLAGMAVGEDGLAPRLTKAMLAEAEARDFPILSTGGSTPFAALGRMVAAANSDPQTMSVLLLAKLYQVAGQRDTASRRSGGELSDLFGTELTVADDATRCVVVGRGVLAPDGMRALPLRTHRPTHLLHEPGARLDSLALGHLTQVLAVDANTILQDARRAIGEGTEALDGALAGRAGSEDALRLRLGSRDTAYRAVLATCPNPERLPLALALAGLAAVTSSAGGRTVAIVPAREREATRAILGELGLTAGVSAEHREVGDLDGAIAEAEAELPIATGLGETWREYRGERVSLLARSRTEAERIVTTVLGPLAGDDQRSAQLRETLFALLDNDLAWNRTATALGLHRQSLVYRIRQVERATGRSVRTTKDIAEFWLARSTWQRFEGDRRRSEEGGREGANR